MVTYAICLPESGPAALHQMQTVCSRHLTILYDAPLRHQIRTWAAAFVVLFVEPRGNPATMNFHGPILRKAAE
jgi:hypothetical protein